MNIKETIQRSQEEFDRTFEVKISSDGFSLWNPTTKFFATHKDLTDFIAKAQLQLLQSILDSIEGLGSYEQSYGGGEFTEGFQEAKDTIALPIRDEINRLSN